MMLKAIFKPYMTATQLGEQAVELVDKEDALNSLRDIYNEAKFSKHHIESSKVEEIKKQYDKVKSI